jgi:hypothetical protein
VLKAPLALLIVVASGFCAFAEDQKKTYKMIDPSDIVDSQTKYANKDIEIKVATCYYADRRDYRCITASATPFAIFTEAILPEAQRKIVEDGCDTVEKALKSEKCLFSLRFNYRAEDVDEDILSGYQRRIVINLDSLELVPMANSRKRR